MSKIDLRGALKVLAAAMRGGEAEPEVKPIDLKALGKELVANEKLTAKQYELIQGMDEEQQGMVKTLLDAMLSKAAEEEETPDAEEMAKQAAAKAEQERAAQAAAAAASSTTANKATDDLIKKLDGFMSNVTGELKKLTDKVTGLETNQGKVVTETLKRQELIARLVANEDAPFDAADLEVMTTSVLEKLEAKMRPVDYSGQGSVAANQSAGNEANAGALRINTGFLLVKPDKKNKEAA